MHSIYDMHIVVWLHYNRKLFEARNVVGYEVDHHPSTGPRALQHTGVEMQQLQMHQSSRCVLPVPAHSHGVEVQYMMDEYLQESDATQ